MHVGLVLEGLVQPNDVGVVHASQDVDLPANEAADVFDVALEARLAHRLHSAPSTRSAVQGADDLPVRAAAKRSGVQGIDAGERGLVCTPVLHITVYWNKTSWVTKRWVGAASGG